MTSLPLAGMPCPDWLPQWHSPADNCRHRRSSRARWEQPSSVMPRCWVRRPAEVGRVLPPTLIRGCSRMTATHGRSAGVFCGRGAGVQKTEADGLGLALAAAVEGEGGVDGSRGERARAGIKKRISCGLGLAAGAAVQGRRWLRGRRSRGRRGRGRTSRSGIMRSVVGWLRRRRTKETRRGRPSRSGIGAVGLGLATVAVGVGVAPAAEGGGGTKSEAGRGRPAN